MATTAKPAPGYTVWRDRKGWRFTSPDGARDSRPFQKEAAAISATHRDAKAANHPAE